MKGLFVLINTIRNDKKFDKAAIIVLALFVLVVCIYWGGINYDTNDDAFISFILSRYGSETVPYTNPLYVRFLSLFYNKLYIVNWWIVFSVIGIVVSMFLVMVDMQVVKTRTNNIIYICVILAVGTYFFALRNINFTRTACYIANAGMILWGFAFAENVKKRRLFLFIIGFILFLWGLFIRFQGGLLTVPFGLSILFGYSIKDDRKLFFCQLFTEVILVATCVLITASGILTSSDALKDFNKIEYGFQKLYDYPYEIEKDLDWEQLNSEGYYLEDIEDIGLYYILDNDIIAPDYLELIDNVVRKRITLNYLYNEVCIVLKFSSMIWIFILTILLAVFSNADRKVVAWYVGGMAVISFYFLMAGRLPNRVFDSILFVGCCDMLICLHISGRRFCFENKTLFDKLMILGIVALALLEVARGNLSYTLNKSAYAYSDVNEDILNYIDADNQNRYYVSVGLMEMITYNENIFLNADRDFCDNMITYRGWSGLLSFYKDMWGEDETNNSINRFLRDDTISSYDSEVLNYLKRHYGEDIYFQDIIELGGYRLGRYCGINLEQ
jgi:hypothetical protein